MGILAIAAAGATYQGFDAVRAASSETTWVEMWRAWGFLAFALLFLLLALRPRLSAGVWEITFLHKFAMAASALMMAHVPHAKADGTVDAILSVTMVVAYLSTRGWKSWRSRPSTGARSAQAGA